jgi:hypothetical protein
MDVPVATFGNGFELHWCVHFCSLSMIFAKTSNIAYNSNLRGSDIPCNPPCIPVRRFRQRHPLLGAPEVRTRGSRLPQLHWRRSAKLHRCMALPPSPHSRRRTRSHHPSNILCHLIDAHLLPIHRFAVIRRRHDEHKNEKEIECLKRVYLCDGVSFLSRFFFFVFFAS